MKNMNDQRKMLVAVLIATILGEIIATENSDIMDSPPKAFVENERMGKLLPSLVHGSINYLGVYEECSPTIFEIDDNEMLVVRESPTDEPYSCSQYFAAKQPGSSLIVKCEILDISSDCDYENLTITTNTERTVICLNPPYPTTYDGQDISIHYQRINVTEAGGFACTIVAQSSTTPTTQAPTTEDPTCIPSIQCGQQGMPNAFRIVGGGDTEEFANPFMVYVITHHGTGASHCGGVLISKRDVLTSANCVDFHDFQYVEVGLCIHDITNISSASQWINSTDTIIHDFNSETLVNNIAIIKLPAESLNYSMCIQPICLPERKIGSLAGETVTALGWGHTAYHGSSASILKELDLEVWSNLDCFNAWLPFYPITITKYHICAYADGNDTCTEDSGGPLFIKNMEDRFTLVGLTSFGLRCGTIGYPGVYTRVSRYLGWINNNTDCP